MVLAARSNRLDDLRPLVPRLLIFLIRHRTPVYNEIVVQR